MSTHATVRIPTPLRNLTGGAGEISAAGSTVGEVLQDLGSEHEGLLDRLLDESGDLRPFVNVFVGRRNVKALDGLHTPVQAGDVVSILPAVAGGCPR